MAKAESKPDPTQFLLSPERATIIPISISGDLWQTASFKGFWAMAGKYWETGFGELYRSLNKPAFVRAPKACAEIRESDLVPGGAGVRAQAVSASGALVDDFVIKESRNAIHVLNAPSPGATASLAIGQAITDMAAKILN